MHDGDLLRVEHLPKELTDKPQKRDGRFFPFDFPISHPGINLDEAVGQFEKYLVMKAIRMTEGNISKAAKLLGVPRGTLRYKLDKHEHEGDEDVEPD